MERFARTVQEHLSDEYDTEIREVTKNNGVHYTGLSIHLPGRAENPVVYLDGHRENYEKGKKFVEVMGNIRQDIEEAVRVTLKRNPFNADILLDFSCLKDKVRMGLVNRSWNGMLIFRPCPWSGSSVPYWKEAMKEAMKSHSACMFSLTGEETSRDLWEWPTGMPSNGLRTN